MSRSRSRSRRWAFALATLGLSSFGPPAATAHAYVRYLSDSGCPYSWRTRTIPVTAYPQGLTSDVTLDDITKAVTGAVSAWSKADPALASCTDLDLQLSIKLLSDPPPAAKFDHLNNIMFRSTWGCMIAADGHSDCRDPNALAITSVFATKWGQIVDADVEVNALVFMWADLDTTPPGGGKQDIQNALTHEMGHFIGLDHTCFGDPTRAHPRDQNGQFIPDCADVTVDDPVRATTMFASAEPGDVSKRSLEPDDQAAICAIYPAGAEDLLACPAPENTSGGCAIGQIGNSGKSGMGMIGSTVTPEAWRADWRNWTGAATVLVSLTALVGARAIRRRRRQRG